MSPLQALQNFRRELIEQVRLDTIGQYRSLSQTLSEEFQQLRQLMKKKLFEQRQFLRAVPFAKTSIEQCPPPKEGLEFTAWIDIGDGVLRDCIVLVAGDGARIRTPCQADLPNEFDLLLNKSGPKARCQLRWRCQDEIGIACLWREASSRREALPFRFYDPSG